MAYSYSKMFGIKTTGLRFFTVYGPYGRPDMSYYLFTEKMYKGEVIDIYNNGDMFRDFTYIDDVVEAVARLLNVQPSKDENDVYHKIYNIGCGNPESILDVVENLEKCIGKKAKTKSLPMPKGDMILTYAKTNELEESIGFKPKTSLEEGLKKFIAWYNLYNRENI